MMKQRLRENNDAYYARALKKGLQHPNTMVEHFLIASDSRRIQHLVSELKLATKWSIADEIHLRTRHLSNQFKALVKKEKGNGSKVKVIKTVDM